MSEKESKTGMIPKNQAYFAIGLSFAAGFLLSLVLMGSQEPVYQKQVLGSTGQIAQDMDVQNELQQHIKTEEIRLAGNTDDAQGWAHLGDLYFDTHEYEKAITAYAKSLEIAPGNTLVMTDMGTMYRAIDQPEKALEIYDTVLKQDPKHPHARFNRGVVLFFELDRKQEAINTWKILVEQNPETKVPDGRLLKDFIAEQEKTL